MNNKNFIAFGDSFINIFLPFKGKNFKICKYAGSPIKGLINKNEVYTDILNKLKSSEINYDYGFFAFGQVDFFFYYYKKLYLDNNKNILNEIYENSINYVKLVKELPNIKEKYILGILPNHITNENYKKFLINYSVFNNDNINLIDNSLELDYVIRNSRIIQYNKLLEIHCKTYGINFCNIFDYLIDKNGLVNSILLLEHNLCNVHIKYEILLFVYLKKCLKFLNKYYDKNKIFNIAENNYNLYIKNVLIKYKIFNDKIYNERKFQRNKIINFLNSI